jgi:molecular chaperone DnaK
VAFDIDANGIVNVSAKDLGTGKEQKVTITSSSGLSKEEIERLMKEAEAHAEEDKKRREQAELRNEADSLIYSVDKTLKDLGDKAATDHVERINKAKEELSQALAGEDYDLIREKKEALQKVLHELSATIYHQTSGGAAAGSGTGGQQAESHGPTVDAEYKVKEDDTK